MEVHQLVPFLNYGDAIGNHALFIRDALRRLGFVSHIYAEGGHEKLKGEFSLIDEHVVRSGGENLLIYHHCIGGTRAYEYFVNARDKKILIYHNITPPEFFADYNAEIYYGAMLGRDELRKLVDEVYMAIGDSEYNSEELISLGFTNVHTIPIPLEVDKFKSVTPNRNILDFYDDEYVNVLFVGRISPNKKQEDVIQIFNRYRREFNEKARLFLVGSYSNMEKYLSFLLSFIGKNRVEQVFFSGHVSFDELAAYYSLGDIFLCMSEHEGFCVPLLESMYFDIPIIAYNSTAVPETLGNAGIVVDVKNVEEITRIMDRVVSDEEYRNGVITVQRERLLYFDKERVEKRMEMFLRQVFEAK